MASADSMCSLHAGTQGAKARSAVQTQLMSGEPPQIRVLREAVEDTVPASVASVAMFAALSKWGSRVPSTFLEVVDLVRGPLAEELAARLGVERARELVRALEQRLSLAEQPTGTVSRAPKAQFEDVPTTSMPKTTGPVRLRVVTGSPSLPTLIVSSVGPGRVELSDAPDLLLLDAVDPPEAWGADLERVAHEAGTVALFGAELASGAAIAKRLASANVGFVGFESEHGIAPLLDLIRSRAG